MKKLLALVLAVVMVLGLSVSAFAVNGINVIELEKEKEEAKELEELELLPYGVETDNKKNEKTYLVFESGAYYIPVETKDLKNIKVAASGNLTAELVEFDPTEQEFEDVDVDFFVVDDKGTKLATGENFEDHFNAGKLVKDNNGKTFNQADGDVEYVAFETIENIFVSELTNDELEKVLEDTDDLEGYDLADYYADELNHIFKNKRFKVKAFEDKGDEYAELKVDLLKVTVADNYTAAYKEGKVEITATRKEDKKDVVANLVIISDVIIFEYEEVKWAAKEEEALVIGDPGYSDYLTDKLGYGEEEYRAEHLRMDGTEAVVVATTEFRAIEGKDLYLETPHGEFEITIEKVAKGQKGVNFTYKEGKLDPCFVLLDEDGKEIKDEAKVKGKLGAIEFGFLGSQIIASDFEIKVNLGIDYFQLGELFGEKLEENDVVKYYVLKDGVQIDEFEIDYAKDDVDEKVELEILGKAGEKLGYYTLTVNEPEVKAEEGGEENPNTGAEPVVGVVSALAVMSLVAGAAVVCGKRH